MKLLELLDSLCYEIPGDASLEGRDIGGITCDSRQVKAGFVFVCIRGGKFDGHDRAAQALENGAAAVVVQRDLHLGSQILVDNTRFAYAVMCANFHGNPSRRLKLVGVTGTNGKTTITNVLKHIFEAAGHKTGLIGTIQNEIDDMTLPAKHTTPDPAQLHALFSRMLAAGCEYVVMEVSSHALDQHRLAGCVFESAIFTNLTQDHLDYHKTMENYYLAKKKLFSMCRQAVINLDDEYGRRLREEISCPVSTFSIQEPGSDFTAKEVCIDAGGSRFLMEGAGEAIPVEFSMPGMFSISNALASAACAHGLGVSLGQIAYGLKTCPGVRGRMEVIPTDTDYTVICDYAHSSDSIEKSLMAAREFAKGRVVILFGCPGNRDTGKRRLMTDAAARLADFIILTSDNPRDEDPLQIIEDALPGLEAHKTPYTVIPDRYRAIRWALEHAQKDDLLLLAGKGHEAYQVLSYGTIFFDERQVVKELLEKIKEEKQK